MAAEVGLRVGFDGGCASSIFYISTLARLNRQKGEAVHLSSFPA